VIKGSDAIMANAEQKVNEEFVNPVVDPLEMWMRDVSPPPPLEVVDKPPGLIGDVAEWMMLTSREPNWNMALMTSTVNLGAGMSSRVIGPTESSTSLFALLLGETGIGKQHYLNCTRLVMPILGVPIGAQRYVSAAALERSIKRHRVWLSLFDEFADWMKRLLNDSKHGGNLEGVMEIMKMLWGLSAPTAVYPTRELGEVDSEDILRPQFSYLAPTTPAGFFAVLRSEEIINGWLNRHWVKNASPGVAERKPELSLRDGLPAKLAEKLKEFRGWIDSRAEFGTYWCQVNWADGRTEARYLRLRALMKTGDSNDRALQVRTAELALRLATILAGTQFRQVVTGADFEWGEAEALSSLKMLREGMEQYHREEMGTYQLANAIYEWLLKQPKRRAAISRISHRWGESGKYRSIFNDAMKVLTEDQFRLEIWTGERPQGGGSRGRVDEAKEGNE